MVARSQVGIDLVARDMASQQIRAVGGSLHTLGGQAGSTRTGFTQATAGAQQYNAMLAASKMHADEAGAGFTGMGSKLSTVMTGAFLGLGVMGVTMLSGALMRIPNAVIGMNASLEKSELQFETLFKDADRAKEHVADLFEFAKVTPFETQPIIDASRKLQTFGGDALNTMENLRMIGDAAAGASTDISEVSFWVGRAYAAIQGGQPFGEARMRLQELALLSPTAAQEMERLQKAGADTSEVWAVMTKELGKYEGAMLKQATTWEGLGATMSDTMNLTIAAAFKPFFEMAKEGMTALIELASSPAFQRGLADFAAGIVSVFKTLVSVAQAALPYIATGFSILVTIVQAVIGVIQHVVGFIERFRLGVIIVAGVIGALLIPALVAWAVAQLAALAPWLLIGAALAAVAAVIVIVADVIGTLVGWLVEWLNSIIPIQAGLTILGEVLGIVGDALGWVVDRVKDVLRFFGLIGPETEEMADGVVTSMGKVDQATAEAMGNLGNFPGKAADDLAAGAPKIAAGVATGVANPLVAGVEAGKDAAVKIAKATPGDIAAGLRAGRDAVTSAGQFLKDTLKNAVSPAKEMAFLEGELTGKALTKALNSQNPEVRAAGLAYKQQVEDRLFALRNGVGDIAIETGTNYADALAKQKAAARAAAVALIDPVKERWADLQDRASTYGANTGEAYVFSLADRLSRTAAINQALSKIKASMETMSPPKNPINPLYGIDKWGWNTGEAFIEPMAAAIESGMDHVRGAMGSIKVAVQPQPFALAGVATGTSPGLAGGRSVLVQQTFHFGPGSVRSDADIRRLGVEMQERAQLQGFAPTLREVGRVAG